jgi:hypothetical protein
MTAVFDLACVGPEGPVLAFVGGGSVSMLADMGDRLEASGRLGARIDIRGPTANIDVAELWESQREAVHARALTPRLVVVHECSPALTCESIERLVVNTRHLGLTTLLLMPPLGVAPRFRANVDFVVATAPVPGDCLGGRYFAHLFAGAPPPPPQAACVADQTRVGTYGVHHATGG